MKDNLKKTALLILGQGVVVLAGFGIKALQTRYLGTEGYGLYAFFSSFVALALLFFRFGFFNSIQILIAETDDETEERKLGGIGFLISAVLGLLFSVFIFSAGYVVDPLFDVEIGYFFKFVSPLGVLLPVRHFVSAYAIGTNRIGLLASYDSVAKIIFLITLLGLIPLEAFNLLPVMALSMATFVFPIGFVYKQVNPSFANLSPLWQQVKQKNREHGIHFYLGTTANQSTYKSDELLISYFISTTQTGFYTLAELLCTPLVMVSQAFSNTFFKRFSHEDRIPQTMLILNIGWLVLSGAGLWLLADWLVPILFGEDFAIVSEYAKGLIFAYFFQGLYQPYMFLTAKSKGKAIRNIDFLEAGVNLAGNILLIPWIGVWGAIYTSILAKFIHYAGKLWLYHRYKTNKL